MPTPLPLCNAPTVCRFGMLSHQWNRLPAFQDVSLRVLASCLLPLDHPPVYVQGELASKKFDLHKPGYGKKYHLYCSAYNAGAVQLIEEAKRVLRMRIDYSSQPSKLDACELMLIYLRDDTWSSPEFCMEVSRALRRKVGCFCCLLPRFQVHTSGLCVALRAPCWLCVAGALTSCARDEDVERIRPRSTERVGSSSRRQKRRGGGQHI